MYSLDFTVVEHLLSGLASALFLLDLYDGYVLHPRHDAAIRGSHERFVLASVRRITRWSGAVSGGLLTCVLFPHPVGYLTALCGLICLADAALDARSHKDDDDWFKRTGRRLRSGLRRVPSSLAATPSAVAA